MAKKSSETLEEGLNRSANKRGLSGKERHRYIGGALHNMGKSKPRSGGKSKTTHKASTATSHTTTHKATTTHTSHKPAAPVKPVRPAEQIVLVARKNAEASKNKPYDVYSIYKGKELWSSQHYRKLSVAKHEAKIEQDAHNYGYKRGKL